MRQEPSVLKGSNLELVDRGLLDGLSDILETHNVEFGPENGKSMPTFFEIQYLSQESIFCKNFKSGTQNMDIASLL